MKRFGIYFFYDEIGKADDYVFIFLEAMLPRFEELLVIVNGKLEEESRRRFDNLPRTSVKTRVNQGFDVWAYKEGLENKGWDSLESFDEIVLMNFTIVGPVNSFVEMFETMDSRDVDFWGITEHHGSKFEPDFENIPRHLQSHFIAIRKRMHSSVEFRGYWENIEPIEGYWDSVLKHESRFTQRFESMGFKHEAYVDTSDLYDFYQYPLFNNPVELIANRNCPIFKRKSFLVSADNYLQESANEIASELLHFLAKTGKYDLEKIRPNIIRSANQFDLSIVENSTFILSPPKQVQRDHQGNCCIVALDPDEELSNLVNSRAESLGINHVYFITARSNHNVNAHVTNSVKIQELQLVIDEITDFDFVIFIDEGAQYEKGLGGAIESRRKIVLSTLLGEPEFFASLLARFSEDSNLRVIMPYPLMHGEYFGGDEIADFVNMASITGGMPASKNEATSGIYTSSFIFRPKLIPGDQLHHSFPPNLAKHEFQEVLENHSSAGQSGRKSINLDSGSIAFALTLKWAENHLANSLHLRASLFRALDGMKPKSINEAIDRVTKFSNESISKIKVEEEEVLAIRNTISWRITAPLRFIRTKLLKFRL